MWEGTDLMPTKKSKSQENDYVPPSEKDLAKRFWDKQQVEKIKAQEKTSPEEKNFDGYRLCGIYSTGHGEHVMDTF